MKLKAEFGEKACFLAGGTEVILSRGAGGTLIDLGRVEELDYVRREGNRIEVGARTRYAAFESSEVSALAEAIRRLGSPQIRNQATVGGALGAARPDGDFSVALLALDAEVKLASTGGERAVPLEAFFTGPGTTVLGPEEMILNLSFQLPDRSAFLKVSRRRGQAYSIVCAAASLYEDGRFCVAAGGVAPTPVRLRETEGFLNGAELEPDAIARAGEVAAGESRPVSDLRASEEYRRAMCGVLVTRLLSGIGAKGKTHTHTS